MKRLAAAAHPVLCIAYLLGAMLYAGVRIFAQPDNVERGEGVLFDLAWRTARGLSVYGDFHQYPYVYCNYPPLYLWLVAPWLRWLGPTLAAGRVLSAASGLIATGVLAAMARREGGNAGAMLAGPLFLLSPFVLYWYPTHHVDMLANALNLGALYAATAGGSASPRGWMAAPLFAAAFFARHSLVAAPLAVSIWYFLADRRRGIQFFACWSALVAAGLVAGTLLTHGWFWAHLTRWPYIFDRMLWLGIGGDFLRLHWPLLLAAPILAGREARRPQSPTFLYTLWVLFSAAITLAAVGHVGASINYFVEWIAGLSLLAASRVAGRPAGLAIGLAALQVAVVYGCVQMTGFTVPPVNTLLAEQVLMQRGTPPGQRLGSLVREAVNQAPGEVLCENPAYSILAGKPVPMNDAFMFGLLETVGQWQDGPIADALQAHRYSLVVIEPATLFPPSIAHAIKANYRPRYRLPEYILLVPR